MEIPWGKNVLMKTQSIQEGNKVKKKLLLILFTVFMALAMAACSSNGKSNENSGNGAATSVQTEQEVQEEQTEPEIPDLTGTWKQVNSKSQDTYHEATITSDTIEINWIMDNGDTKSLYWAGSFTPPTTADEPYTFDSVNDIEKTTPALLASGDESKTFTYENGQLSYEASAMGTTQTVRMEKE